MTPTTTAAPVLSYLQRQTLATVADKPQYIATRGDAQPLQRLLTLGYITLTPRGEGSALSLVSITSKGRKALADLAHEKERN